jgi:hypothetical protein
MACVYIAALYLQFCVWMKSDGSPFFIQMKSDPNLSAQLVRDVKNAGYARSSAQGHSG